jgi:hypothetical protein
MMVFGVIFPHMYIFFEHLEVYKQPAGQFSSICIPFAPISVPKSYLVKGMNRFFSTDFTEVAVYVESLVLSCLIL